MAFSGLYGVGTYAPGLFGTGFGYGATSGGGAYGAPFVLANGNCFPRNNVINTRVIAGAPGKNGRDGSGGSGAIPNDTDLVNANNVSWYIRSGDGLVMNNSAAISPGGAFNDDAAVGNQGLVGLGLEGLADTPIRDFRSITVRVRRTKNTVLAPFEGIVYLVVLIKRAAGVWDPTVDVVAQVLNTPFPWTVTPDFNNFTIQATDPVWSSIGGVGGLPVSGTGLGAPLTTLEGYNQDSTILFSGIQTEPLLPRLTHLAPINLTQGNSDYREALETITQFITIRTTLRSFHFQFLR